MVFGRLNMREATEHRKCLEEIRSSVDISNLLHHFLSFEIPLWHTHTHTHIYTHTHTYASLDREDPLEKEMATHTSILGWRFPWTEEPGRLQSTESPRVTHN